MAICHSTEIALPVLDTLSDAADESESLNCALECYHELVSAFIVRSVELPRDIKQVGRLTHGLDTLFNNILVREQRLNEFLRKYS